MTYLIDGHNLIPHIPNLSLDQLDDEDTLVTMLVNFSIKRNCQVEVFFDQGQLNSKREFKRGRVHVHFVLPPMIADGAIIARLLGIGKAAKNYTVITSDNTVQNRVRKFGANVITSQKFAQMIQIQDNKKEIGSHGEHPANREIEIEEWMRLFSSGKSDPPKT